MATRLKILKVIHTSCSTKSILYKHKVIVMQLSFVCYFKAKRLAEKYFSLYFYLHLTYCGETFYFRSRSMPIITLLAPNNQNLTWLLFVDINAFQPLYQKKKYINNIVSAGYLNWLMLTVRWLWSIKSVSSRQRSLLVLLKSFEGYVSVLMILLSVPTFSVYMNNLVSNMLCLCICK